MNELKNRAAGELAQARDSLALAQKNIERMIDELGKDDEEVTADEWADWLVTEYQDSVRGLNSSLERIRGTVNRTALRMVCAKRITEIV
jgi:hypothetical protein